MFWVSVAAALVPIVVAVVRGIGRGYVPVGDNAYFLIRSRDVFTRHHPLLGTWTSASLNTDSNFNNPGPLMFDLLALPSRLGGGVGLAVGVALLNVGSVLGVAVMARRRGGPVVGVAAMFVVALLCSSLGSEILYDPWQPHSLLLPFLFGLTCAWSVAAGDLVALPWALAVGSLVVQTHLSYAVLVVAVGGWAAFALVASLRRERTGQPEAWDRRRGSIVKALVWSVLVVALCWVQPAIENFTADDQGNLTRLAGNMAGSGETVGVRRGTAVVADTMVVPPFWFRPSFEQALASDPARPDVTLLPRSVDPSFPVAAALLGALGVGLVAAAWDARRRGDRQASAGLSVSAVALGSGLVTSWQLPFGVFGIAAHQFRWMWPVATFTGLAALAYGLQRVTRDERAVRTAGWGLAAATIVVAVVTLPTYTVRAGPLADRTAGDTIEEVGRQMVALEGEGTLLVDVAGIRFAEPYTGPVMAELQRRNIPFVADEEGMVRQLGESRRLDGNAQRLLFREGDAASVTPPGARRVVYVEGLTAAEQRERDDLRDQIVGYLTAEGVRLKDGHDASMTPGELALLPQPGDRRGAQSVVASGLFRALLDRDLVVVDDEWRDQAERWRSLEVQWAFRTLGLFLAPLEGGDS